MIVQSALQKYAERKIKNFHKERRRGNEQLIGASEIGLCLRRIKFAKQSLRDGPSLGGWGAAQRGSTFEDHFWTPAMRKLYGKNLLYTGAQQNTLTYGGLRATPDGLLINQPRDALRYLGVNDIGPSGEICLDCKSIDPRIALQGPKVEHEFQSQIQMALLRLTTKHKPDYALISYVNASFFDDVVEFVVRYDHSVYETAKQRAASIKQAKSPVELLPEGWLAGARECEYCPFANPCREMRGEVPPVSKADNLDKGLKEEIIALAREEKRWAAKAGVMEEEQRKMQYAIKELLRAHGLNRIEHAGIVVVWSPVKGRISFDMPALRAAAAKLGLDVQAFETVGQPTDRLVITIKEPVASAVKSS